jgi:hypothetical protein
MRRRAKCLTGILTLKGQYPQLCEQGQFVDLPHGALCERDGRFCVGGVVDRGVQRGEPLESFLLWAMRRDALLQGR